MITKRKFWTVASLLALVGFAGSSAVAWRFTSPGAQRCDAAWAFEAANPQLLVAHADAIVVAQAVATYPGRIATSEGGEDALPFEVVEFRVDRALKGAFPTGLVLVERAGGVEPLSGIHHVIDIDGGEFTTGHTYLLFLNEQPGDTGYYYQVNDQGRYELAGNKLRALEPDEDPVQKLFDRRTVAEASALVRRILGQ